MSDDPVITITDVRRAGHCVSGARRWFEAHGLDFKDFLANGVPSSVMAATNDALGLRVVEIKRQTDGK